MKDPRDIIIAPVVSEKRYALIDATSTRSSSTPTPASPRSTTPIEAIFGVQGPQGEHAEPQGQAPAHPALHTSASVPTPSGPIVTLAAGDRIELFES